MIIAVKGIIHMARRTEFRKAALDKLSSPEELDRLMQITSPGSWLLLAALAVVLVMVLFWSILGRINTTLEQSGVLALSNPSVFISAPTTGRVANVMVQPDDEVYEGDIIAYLSTEEGLTTVLSDVEGRVTAVRAQEGTTVSAGSALVTLQLSDAQQQREQVVLYVTLADSQQIKVGMSAQVLPANVEAEKYGYIKGEVSAISEFRATREEMLFMLGDADYVDVLLRSGNVFEVRVELERDSAGFWVWSASDGPEFPIMTGTACSVTIRIDSQRPISKVFNLE